LLSQLVQHIALLRRYVPRLVAGIHLVRFQTSDLCVLDEQQDGRGEIPTERRCATKIACFTGFRNFPTHIKEQPWCCCRFAGGCTCSKLVICRLVKARIKNHECEGAIKGMQFSLVQVVLLTTKDP
jgi:hypothetical protein